MACDWGGHAADVECFPGDEFAGQRVIVTLNFGDPAAVMVGVLVDRTCDGEVTVDTDQGRRYGWPALRIEPDCARPVVGSPT